MVAAWVAWVAKNIASDARDAEHAQAQIAGEALAATRRQTELGAVPQLVALGPVLHHARAGKPPRLTVAIKNGGPTTAYGVILSAAIARERDLSTVDEATRNASRREPGLVAGEHLDTLGVPMPTSADAEWLAVTVECYTPLGTAVRQDYLWGPKDAKWRLHRVTITPQVKACRMRWETPGSPRGGVRRPQTAGSMTPAIGPQAGSGLLRSVALASFWRVDVAVRR